MNIRRVFNQKILMTLQRERRESERDPVGQVCLNRFCKSLNFDAESVISDAGDRMSQKKYNNLFA